MSERPVVLHLITRFLDGGAEKTTKNTLKTLATADTDYELRLGTGSEHDPTRLSDLESAGVETVVFQSLRHYNPITAVVAVLAVAWYLHREGVDILHTHSTEAGIVGRLAAWLVRTPIVVHDLEGDPITEDRCYLLNRFLLFAERRCAPMADRIVAKSESLRDKYLDRGIGHYEQYVVIHIGVDLDRFRAVESNMDTDGLKLVFVGRLANGKGLYDLLDAVDRLEDTKLRIVGDGPLWDRLQQAIDERDLPVKLLGYREDIPAQLAASDVLVLPSYREGTPRVIAEAMATGLPVVSTDIAGIPEQVVDGETGYLVDPGDIDALVDRLQRLKDPNRRAVFGRRARAKVDKFAMATATDRYLSLYSELWPPDDRPKEVSSESH